MHAIEKILARASGRKKVASGEIVIAGVKSQDCCKFGPGYIVTATASG